MAEKEGLLPFKLIEDEAGEALTSYSGLPLVVETCEALGLTRLVKQHVRIKRRQRGFSESEYVQSLTALMAAGGDCLEDIERLRSDKGLKLLVGEMPSAEAARFFLYGFHDEKLLEGRPEEGAFIATESAPLAGLWEVQRRRSSGSSSGSSLSLGSSSGSSLSLDSEVVSRWLPPAN